MFLSSYAPLFLLLAIRFDGPALRIACGVAAVVGVVGMLALLHRQQHGPPALPYKVIDAQPAGTEASAYLAGYLLPFVTASEPGTRDLVAYVLFGVVAYAVHARTGIIQVNPLLFVLGWSVLRVTTTSRSSTSGPGAAAYPATGSSRYLITKRRIVPPEEVSASRMADDVLVDRTRR